MTDQELLDTLDSTDLGEWADLLREGEDPTVVAVGLTLCLHDEDAYDPEIRPVIERIAEFAR